MTLAIAIAAIVLDSILLGLITPLLPEIEARMGVGEGALGLALGAYAIPILLASIAIGRGVDRFGRRRFVFAGLLLVAIGSVLIAAAESLPPLIAGRAIQGVGSAASWIAALAIVSDLAPEGRKGEAIGFALAANSGGALAGPALGGVLGDALGFSAPFLIVAGLGVLTLLVAIVFLPPLPGTGEGTGDIGERLRSLLGPGVLVATLVMVGGAATLGAIDVVVPLDLDDRLGLGPATIGLIFAGVILIDAIAAPIAGREGDRRGRAPVAVAGLALIAVSTALLAALGGTTGALVALAVFGLAVGVIFAAAVPWLDEAFGAADRGLAYGGVNVIYAVGYVVGPIAGGWLLELASADTAYLVIAVVALAGAVAIRGGAGYAPSSAR